MELLTKMEGSDRTCSPVVDFGEMLDGDKLENLKNALLARGVKQEVLDDVIASHAIANLKVYFRAGAKAGMKGGKDKAPLTDEEIQAKLDKMIPGVATEREAVSAEKKLDAAAKAYDQMTAEEQEAYLARLQARLKAKTE